MTVVRLTIVANELEAEMRCGLLRSGGIECTYRRTDVAAAVGAYAPGSPVGPTEVLVDETELERARTVPASVGRGG